MIIKYNHLITMQVNSYGVMHSIIKGIKVKISIPKTVYRMLLLSLSIS